MQPTTMKPRSAFKRIAITGVAATLALSLAACGGGEKKSAANNGSAEDGFASNGLYDPENLVAKTEAGTEKVDSVRWGLRTGEPATIDPGKTGNDSDYIVTGNLCESLYQVDEKFGPQPNLATEADWSDPTTLELTLRDDVKFWNGKPMTAKDVVATLERTANPKNQSIYASAFALVKKFEAVDDTHVRVSFQVHDGDFINNISGPAGRIMEAASIKELGADLGTPKGGVMCTGPYQLDKWTPGQSVSIKANPEYWDGAPKVEKIEFVPTQDDAALTSALTSGELDGAFDVPEASAKQLATSGKGQLVVGPSNSTVSFGPTSAKGASSDPKVREALSLAIDRDSVIKNLLKGYGAPASTFTVPFQFEGLEQADIFTKAYDDLPEPEVDLDKAKKLVKEAGYEGKSLKIAVPSGNQMLQNIATVVKDAAEKIGMKMTIEQRQPADYAQFFYAPEAREGVDFISAVGYQDTPGVNTYASLNALQGEQGLFNWTQYKNDEVTGLLQKARTAEDTKTAAESFVKAQEIFAPAKLQVTLGVQYTRTYMREGLTGATTSMSYINTPWAKNLGGAAK
ncbi:ABC transporter substrate-binding protein [Galactobacter sp.]|mgnify:CR=1 FL=1|uniref:ABC transporter substrate-binding protein n=1 Tax=Galactobacter sp. TaxID=2676125 RepID=UPI0025BABA37|nr:ABC transporter substrate-binding protein [Galactobacter sp.]